VEFARVDAFRRLLTHQANDDPFTASPANAGRLAKYTVVVPQVQRDREARRKKVWTTYGIADWKGNIRYVGCTEFPLAKRLAGHVGASVHGWDRWAVFLRGEMEAGRHVSIVQIGIWRTIADARRMEAETISDLISSGAKLLNSRIIGRRRCRSCGAPNSGRWHSCCLGGIVRAAFIKRPVITDIANESHDNETRARETAGGR
jgi:hypothetical protein